MQPLKILIIEDVASVVETVSLALEMRWPDVSIISTPHGEEGVTLVETEAPDAVIIDLGLPDISGFQVLKRIRLFSDVPALVLTARSDEADIVKGLEWGADDYLVKPFRQLELLARVKAVIRRQGGKRENELAVGQLRFEPVACQLTYNGQEIKITRSEGLILAHLMRNAGTTVSHVSMAEAVWGIDYPDAENSIKVHIRRLRLKLEEDPGEPKIIRTRSGIGYYIDKNI